MATTNANTRQETGRRLQICGFPDKWAEELTYDDIAWYLFDLLSKYGPIDNISVSQSKKNLLIYGVVDMCHESDVQRVKRELLDKHNRYPLRNWDCSLSFLQKDPNATSTNAVKKDSEPSVVVEGGMNGKKGVLRENTTTNVPHQHQDQTTAPLTGTDWAKSKQHAAADDNNSKTAVGVGNNSDPVVVYGRTQMLSIRESLDDTKPVELGPEFNAILRGNSNTNNSGNDQNAAGGGGGGGSGRIFFSRIRGDNHGNHGGKSLKSANANNNANASRGRGRLRNNKDDQTDTGGNGN